MLFTPVSAWQSSKRNTRNIFYENKLFSPNKFPNVHHFSHKTWKKFFKVLKFDVTDIFQSTFLLDIFLNLYLIFGF